MTEDEMVGWHHRFNGHDFEQSPGDSEGQRSLACCSPWGCKESYIANEQQQKIIIIISDTWNTDKNYFPRL